MPNEASFTNSFTVAFSFIASSAFYLFVYPFGGSINLYSLLFSFFLSLSIVASMIVSSRIRNLYSYCPFVLVVSFSIMFAVMWLSVGSNTDLRVDGDTIISDGSITTSGYIYFLREAFVYAAAGTLICLLIVMLERTLRRS